MFLKLVLKLVLILISCSELSCISHTPHSCGEGKNQLMIVAWAMKLIGHLVKHECTELLREQKQNNKKKCWQTLFILYLIYSSKE
jgi:hypothetical protein